MTQAASKLKPEQWAVVLDAAALGGRSRASSGDMPCTTYVWPKVRVEREVACLGTGIVASASGPEMVELLAEWMLRLAW